VVHRLTVRDALPDELLRPFEDEVSAVMNRLYVAPRSRREGLGLALAWAAIARAAELGYARIILDVIPQRTHVVALYRSLGFTDIEPFVDYPFEMVFLARHL
jgi:ribosomal protein S18 acetylase RimI-like enzyme